MPASATEWIDSANIADDRVKRKAMNLMMAMAEFPKNAATTALLPPSPPTAMTDLPDPPDDRVLIPG